MRPDLSRGSRAPPASKRLLHRTVPSSSATGAWGLLNGTPMPKLIHHFEPLTLEKRPHDPHLDGAGLTFETLEHGGDEPDTMPQAIKLIDAEGRSCIYVPIREGGEVVDSKGFELVRDDLTED